MFFPNECPIKKVLRMAYDQMRLYDGRLSFAMQLMLLEVGVEPYEFYKAYDSLFTEKGGE